MIYYSSLNIIFFKWQRKKYKHERLLDMEIIALQSELAKFILAEVLEKDGVFSIAQSVKYKDQYDQSGSLDYCKKSEKHCTICEVREHFFFILRDRDLDKNIWIVTVTFVMFNIDGPVVYVAYIKRNPIRRKNTNWNRL